MLVYSETLRLQFILPKHLSVSYKTKTIQVFVREMNINRLNLNIGSTNIDWVLARIMYQ